MAIAGLHNVPVLESSILRESQPSSSGRRGNQGRLSTRASSILQMWRELEDECAVNRAHERGRSRLQQEGSDGLPNCQEGEVAGGIDDLSESENGSVNNSGSHMGTMNENEDRDDRQSMTSELSQDLGEVERERVRQIFREWMNSGGSTQGRNVSHMNRSSRAQWLGETDCERVRIVREWIQMTSQQREACIGNREEQVAEIGSQIERVRDGQVLDYSENQTDNSRRENSRRVIRKLCGRQALLDLLSKKEQERRLELQGLQATRPVSCFAHRNRIQSLLRIRCFQNMRYAESRRPSSSAESELGLLRQRQTVSGLREGYLSRLDNSVPAQVSDQSDGPSDKSTDGLRDEQTQGSSAIEALDSAQELQSDNGVGNLVISANLDQSDLPSGESGLQKLLINEQNDRNRDSIVGSSAFPSQSSGCSTRSPSSEELVAQVEALQHHAVDNGGANRQEMATTNNLDGSPDYENTVLNSVEPSTSVNRELGDVEGSNDTTNQQCDSDREENGAVNLSEDLNGDVSEDVNGQESSLQVDEWHEQVSEFEEREWEGSVLSNQWRDDDQVETDRRHWPGDGEVSSRDALDNEVGEQNDAQEDYWHENDSQEAPTDWLGMPSGAGATSSGRVDTYYFSDDDNVYNMELRELLNRRTVSSLLHSGFRESLDQLIQSYVERQTHTADDWELHEMSPPPYAAQSQEQLDADHNEDSGASEGSQRLPPMPPPVPQAHWRQVLHRANWSRHEICQRPGTEWESINDLRIDMARLQQRLNNMQRMLEACMDMQLELQRSVRQEVSAALNRSIAPSESPENAPPKDSLKWDCVRKGICCMCSDSNIDSLLYRCGHMCTCTKCANILVQGNGKCPMCQAPVIEVIRAYFTQ